MASKRVWRQPDHEDSERTRVSGTSPRPLMLLTEGMEPLLTASEVCELLRVSSRHLRRLAVPCVRFGRLVRYRRGDVFRWVEARRDSA